MRHFSKTLCAALAATFALGTAVPTMAAPAFSRAVPTIDSTVIQVQGNRNDRRSERRDDRRDNRANRRDDRRAERRNDRRDARFERRNGNAYYNGRRGYRERRPGYREYNGYWFPAAAFIAGAIIGGATSGAGSSSSSHVAWCQERYRSYRVSDNTFQPYSGPRQRCVSPY